MIIATAGHVDHGKTRLLHALTGIDTDRLPQEKKRGISIDLGFAYYDLGDGLSLGFVDVPGHERFIRNMLAGVASIDFVLFVIAADDGPMPQTFEHLVILNYLQVQRGAIVLSKIDRVEEDRILDVTKQIKIMLRETSLSGIPIFPVSCVTGNGVGALRNYLEIEALKLDQPASNGYFRLSIDRFLTFTAPSHQ